LIPDKHFKLELFYAPITSSPQMQSKTSGICYQQQINNPSSETTVQLLDNTKQPEKKVIHLISIYIYLYTIKIKNN